MFVGRAAECARLLRALQDARGGRSSLLVLRGEAGIGKTALLGYVLNRADGLRPVRICPLPVENERPYSGLRDLLAPLVGDLSRLAPEQTALLRGVLEIGPPMTTDALAVGAATLNLWAAAAERHPLLIIVDDAHWLDAESRTAILFAARRFHAEPIAMLMAERQIASEPLDVGEDSLVVRELEDAAALELVQRTVRRKLSTDEAARIVRCGHGNPLALIEIASSVSQEPAVESPEPQAAGREALEGLYVRRLSALPSRTRDALLALTLPDSSQAGFLVGILEELNLSIDDLLPAEEAGLVDITPTEVAFAHPLIRSAVAGSGAPATLRAANAAVARAYSQAGDVDRAVWHLACTVVGWNDELAVSLEQMGQRSAQRGAHAAAHRIFVRSAELRRDPSAAAADRLSAARHAHLAGLTREAMIESDRVLDASDDPVLRADAGAVRAIVESMNGSPRRSYEIYFEHALEVLETDKDRATILLASAVFPCLQASSMRAAVETAQVAMDVAVEASRGPALMASTNLAMCWILTGEARRAQPLLERCYAAITDAPASEVEPLLTLLSQILFWIEDYEQVLVVCRRLDEHARRTRSPLTMVRINAPWAATEFRLGHWASAQARLAGGAKLAEAAGERAEVANMLAWGSTVEAALGRDADVRKHYAETMEIAEALRVETIRLIAGAGLGALELSLGRSREAIAVLERVGAECESAGIGDPGILPWAPDLIEAYARTGRRDEAAEATERLAAQAEACDRTLARATAARGRLLICEDDAIDAVHDVAVREHDRTPVPFERARTELVYGERLRRTRRRTKARYALNQALEVFEGLGASVWAARARRELEATGLRAQRRSDPIPARLTPQEQQVASLVASGATNQEAAVALFLSPKTIEAHLSSVYRKLGLRSRTELAATLTHN